MEILWLAIVIYTVGLAAVLHFRPSRMFNDNGTWKEFGYNRSTRHTLFPFWLFSIVWAFVSYAVAAAITWRFAAGTATAAVAFYEQAPPSDEEVIPVSRYRRPTPYPAAANEPTYYEPAAEEEAPPPTRRTKPRAGYYVLEPTGEEGLRRYVYYGTAPPPA
jgi:hypothetical protein